MDGLLFQILPDLLNFLMLRFAGPVLSLTKIYKKNDVRMRNDDILADKTDLLHTFYVVGIGNPPSVESMWSSCFHVLLVISIIGWFLCPFCYLTFVWTCNESCVCSKCHVIIICSIFILSVGPVFMSNIRASNSLVGLTFEKVCY